MRIITRAEWGARPPKSTPRRITTPTAELWLHHTASPTGYEARIRAIQDFHMDTRGWNDIAYSYLINHEGTIYEGRGAGIAGGHTAGHNTISHAICLLGDFNQAQPTDAALNATAELVRYGAEEGWWPAALTGGHRDASGANTSCPGNNLHSKIPTINQLASQEADPMALTPSEENTAKALHAALEAAGYGTLASRTAAVGQLVGLIKATPAGGLSEEQVKAIVESARLDVP